MRAYRSPLAELLELQRQVSRVFEEIQAERGRMASPPRIYPPVDVVVGDEEYVFLVDLPQVGAGDVEVVVTDGALVIRGTKKSPEEEGSNIRRERQFGPFVRALPLPSDVDVSDASARLSRGVLTVRIPRQARSGRKRIAVVEDDGSAD